MTRGAMRDWPAWKWAAVIAAVFLGGGVLDVAGQWARPYLGPNAPFILWAFVAAAALGSLLRDRSASSEQGPEQKSGADDGTAVQIAAERRFRLGFLLAWAAVGVIGILLTGGFGELVRSVRSLPPGDWPIIAVLLAHIALFVTAFVVALTDSWPYYTLAALGLLALTVLMIPDPSTSLVVGGLLVVAGAFLLTLRSLRASLWFCGIVGAEWLLWTTMMNGAEVHDFSDGLTGAIFAGLVGLLAWRYGPRLHSA